MSRFEELLRHPILQGKGGDLTAGSILLGVLIFAAAVVLARAIQRAIARLLASRGHPPGAQAALGKIARYAVVLVGLGVALSSAGLDITAMLAASTVLLVGLGFGLQNIAQNFVSGLILLIEQPIRPGDFVRVGDTFGVVDDVGLRATRIITRDQVAIIVPNSDLVTTQVVNHSRPTATLRVTVEVGVAYGSDLGLVRETLLAAARAQPAVLPEPPPEIRFLGFGDSSLDLAVLVWISDPREDLRVASQLRFAVDEAFRRASISIPFPQRDLHLRSGLASLGGPGPPGPAARG
jgi:small-conductance mechanosensitive channel